MNASGALELAASVEIVAPWLRRLMLGRSVWRGRPSQLAFSLVLRSDDRWQDPAWPADDRVLLDVLPHAAERAGLCLRVSEAQGQVYVQLSPAPRVVRRRRSKRAGAGPLQLSLFEGAV